MMPPTLSYLFRIAAATSMHCSLSFVGHYRKRYGYFSEGEVAMSSRQSCRRGAAALEFAVVAPLLFLFFFGIVEFGRAMMVLSVVTNSARSGVRAGAVTAGDYETIRDT